MTSITKVYEPPICTRSDSAIMRLDGVRLDRILRSITERDDVINAAFRELFVLFADSPIELAHVEHLKLRLQSERHREQKLGQAHPALECPISGQLMKDPVVAADGHLYERANIKAWFDTLSATSPVTGDTIRNIELVENVNMKLGIKLMLSKMV